MKNRVRQQLLQIVDAVLDGARQCVHLSHESATRMVGEIAEALPLFDDPEIAPRTESLAAALTRLVERTGSAQDVVDRVVDLQTALHAIEATYTVVFLPYNAAMWDSLHTVWQAADADPRCEAIVVPIPFAELTPERTLKEWRLHDKDFPAEVPVVDHKRFDLQAVHPDIVYVHNPYDGYNAVTSVHPDYYSEALRPHCQMLVYVPYWVSVGQLAEHFDQHPSFEHFDKVIYQNEEYAQRAIGHWSSNKIVPLGSPKFDYVLSPGGPLPAAWASKIEGKTVLLQLTSLGPLLQYEGEVLRKLDDVLDAIQRNEDLVLWWRPHPLEKATIDSMRPGLRAAYDALLARARGMSRVILDTTPDLQRAIRWTDAYYGHGSSVTTLYGLTGKPIIVMDEPAKTDVPSGEAYAEDWFPQDAAVPAWTRFIRPEWFHPEGAFTYLRRQIEENAGVVPGQREFFASLATNSDGTAGEHIHRYVMACAAGS